MPGGMQVEAWWLHYCLCEAASQHVAEDQPRQDCFFCGNFKTSFDHCKPQTISFDIFSVSLVQPCGLKL